jgi:hypothetical protein
LLHIRLGGENLTAETRWKLHRARNFLGGHGARGIEFLRVEGGGEISGESGGANQSK